MGVHFHFDHDGYKFWSANKTIKGKTIRYYFGIATYGEELAKKLANMCYDKMSDYQSFSKRNLSALRNYVTRLKDKHRYIRRKNENSES
jgi:hypothetical protein